MAAKKCKGLQITENSWRLLKMAENGCKQFLFQLLEITGYSLTWQEMAGNGQIWLEMAGKGWN